LIESWFKNRYYPFGWKIAMNASKRPWYDLHWSTAIIVLAMVVIAFLLEIQTDGTPANPGAYWGAKYQYGSPWIYLTRTVESTRTLGGPWWFYGDPSGREVFPLILTLDVTMCVVAIMLIAFLIECRCRSQNRWFQFTLREMICLMIIVAFMLSWTLTHRAEQKRIYEISEWSEGE
jgi:hypothetical protein